MSNFRTAALAVLLLVGCPDASDGPTPSDPLDTAGGDAQSEASPPTVVVISPGADAIFILGTTVIVRARVTDSDSPLTGISVQMSSDRDGMLTTAQSDVGGVVELSWSELTAGVHELTLTATDPDGLTGTATAQLRINALPTAPSVAISPAEPLPSDPLVAQIAVDAVDPDDGPSPLTYRFQWYRNGVATEVEDATLPAVNTASGETWEVRVAAWDGHAKGLKGTASVTIGKGAPQCLDAVITPKPVTAATGATCTCADLDASGHTSVTTSCIFDVDGNTVAAVDCELAPGSVTRGDVVSCLLTASGGGLSGKAAASGESVVANAAPSAPVVAVAPAVATLVDTLVCDLTTPSLDADADPISYEVVWLVEAYENPGFGLAVPAAVLRRNPTTFAQAGDAVTCRVIASDGQDAAAAVFGLAVVLGPAPCSAGCNDQNPCTFDGCVSELCVFAGKSCDDGNVCTDDTCDATTGGCVAVPALCDDGDPCTTDSCHPALTPSCQSSPAAPGVCGKQCLSAASCDDGNPCTADDCVNDACVNAAPDCEDGDACTLDFCDPSTQGCLHEPYPGCGEGCMSAFDCDDGEICTSDHCADGTCEHQPLSFCVPCDMDADCAVPPSGPSLCLVSTCDLGVNTCTYAPRVCDDGLPCSADYCDPTSGCQTKTADVCTLGCASAADCADGNVCTTDYCDLTTHLCAHLPIHCDDGSACTIDFCDPASGQCAHSDLPSCVVPACAKDSDCTIGPCAIGRCLQPGPAGHCVFDVRRCNDFNPCTEDTCSPTFGCVFEPIAQCGGCTDAQQCNDDNVCSQDSCADGVCAASAVAGCPAASECLSDKDCTDGSTCTVDRCVAGGICAYLPVSCTSVDPCATAFDGECVEGQGCQFPGTCSGCPCDDHDPCTTDACDVTGCVFTPKPECAGCEKDGDCSDGDACTADECDGATCRFTPISGCRPCETDAECKGPDACTFERCQDGHCVHTFELCYDALGCTKDFGSCGGKPTDILPPLGGSCGQGQPAACLPNVGCLHLPVLNCGVEYFGVAAIDVPCQSDAECSTGHACWPGVCNVPVGRCESGPKTCVPSGLNKFAWCDPGSGSCEEIDKPGWVGCQLDSDCQLGDDKSGLFDACTLSYCLLNQCVAFEKPCDDNNPCTEDLCAKGSGCVFLPKAECKGCGKDADCEDGSPCTLDQCDEGTGGCNQVVIEGCTACSVEHADAMCEDGDECTTGICLPSTTAHIHGTCTQLTVQPAQNPACGCKSDQECLDQSPCTVDRCLLQSGLCTNALTKCVDGDPCTQDGTFVCFEDAPGCTYEPEDVCDGMECETAADCGVPFDPCLIAECESGTCGMGFKQCDDANPATFDYCAPGTGECAFATKPGAQPCTVGDLEPDAACDDQDACTLDVCAPVGEAGPGDVGQCYYLVQACSDFDPCTVDSCDAKAGCSFELIIDCEGCQADLDCDDGNFCTLDTCGTEKAGKCSHAANPACN